MTDKPDLTEFEQLTEVEQLRRALDAAQSQLAKTRKRNQGLVDATLAGARDAMLALGPLPAVPVPKLAGSTKKEEVALWHLTDWQGAKVTTSYNSHVMRERVLRYCDKAAKLTNIQRSHHPVRRCVIMFGGDMGEGLFQFPQQPFEIDATLFGQYAQVARLEVEVVRRALAIYETVEVVAEWGNHGRAGSKRAAVPLSDNFDRMAYEFARSLLAESADGPRVKWEDCEEDIQHVEIGNYRALLIHGDEIGRNGFASRNTIVDHIGRWQAGAHDWQFLDCYKGHQHFHGEDPLPNGYGSVYHTGSPESDSRYASVRVGAGSRPSQRLHFIDPEEGRVTVPTGYGSIRSVRDLFLLDEMLGTGPEIPSLPFRALVRERLATGEQRYGDAYLARTTNLAEALEEAPDAVVWSALEIDRLDLTERQRESLTVLGGDIVQAANRLDRAVRALRCAIDRIV